MTFGKIILFLLLLLILTGGGFAYWFYSDLRRPLAHQHASTFVEIPRGSSVEEIVNTLHRQGVIGHKWPLLAYIRLTSAAPKLKAGEYTFPSPITPLEVLSKLEEGQQRLQKFTVREGLTRWDIAAAMAKLPDIKASAAEILEMMNDTSGIKEIDPQAANLEGYLFPDTYNFPPNSSAPEIISFMVQRFKKVWADKFNSEAAASGQTPRQIMTVASLIESEAKLKEDRPLVSSVIYNRLQKGMNLGIDSTAIYAARLAGKWRNDGKVYQSYLDLPSPYNTRKNFGLPPGPVVSPGADSIQAAIHPAQSDYLYYVREPSRNDGAHNFYASETDFQKGVQALREWEKQRDAGLLKNDSAQTPVPTPNN